jgi:hypothetical protein
LKAKKLTTFAPWLPFFLCFLTKSIPPQKKHTCTPRSFGRRPPTSLVSCFFSQYSTRKS